MGHLRQWCSGTQILERESEWIDSVGSESDLQGISGVETDEPCVCTVRTGPDL